MLLSTTTKPALGDGAPTYAGRQTTWLTNAENNDQGIQNRLEAGHNVLFGTGVLAGSYSGDLLTAGSGLAVNVAAFNALIGFILDFDDVSVIGGLADGTLNYLWLFQDGSFDSTTSSTNPGTANNPAIALGTATTVAGAVTAVSNVRIEIVIGGKGSREEVFGPEESGTHQKLWDADTELRTGGTASIYELTLDGTPQPGTMVELFRGTGEDVRLARNIAWTITGNVITILSGYRPIDDADTRRERIRVVYTPS